MNADHERQRHLPIATLAHEALTNLARQPARAVLCALGTVVAVAAFVAINGLTQTARNAVSASFNELRATTVEFQGGTSHDPILTEKGVARLQRLRGVVSAGLLWDLDQQQPLTVTRSPAGAVADARDSAQLSFTAASASALTAIGARVSAGRLYDAGADRYHQMVALLGAAAAQQLGITSTLGSPAIFVGDAALTVVGIVRSAQQESQVLLDVIVPPYVASIIGVNSDPRRVIARTDPGAAQLIGRQGPYALAPYAARQITAEVPPNPSTLRQQVESSLSTLLTVLALAGLGIGLLSIAAITMLSVSQRRAEIGLRRAIGYHRLDVALLILAEAGGAGILGGILGASLGLLATSLVATAHGWVPVISLQLVAVAPLLGVAVGVLAGAYPAAMAIRIAPMAALRS